MSIAKSPSGEKLLKALLLAVKVVLAQVEDVGNQVRLVHADHFGKPFKQSFRLGRFFGREIFGLFNRPIFLVEFAAQNLKQGRHGTSIRN